MTSVRRRGRSGGRTDTVQPPYCARRSALQAAHSGFPPVPYRHVGAWHRAHGPVWLGAHVTSCGRGWGVCSGSFMPSPVPLLPGCGCGRRGAARRRRPASRRAAPSRGGCTGARTGRSSGAAAWSNRRRVGPRRDPRKYAATSFGGRASHRGSGMVLSLFYCNMCSNFCASADMTRADLHSAVLLSPRMGGRQGCRPGSAGSLREQADP